MASASPDDGRGASLNPPRQLQKTVITIPQILPRERVFPIQIGGEMFKLSGASLSSDAPSYFSQYFLCQISEAESRGKDAGSAIRTLYIDRDPATFRDIAQHLQGYHISPRDGTHFVRLFADAQFYSLPKLISQLYEESIFISIGHREFQIPRDIFNDPANSPNYFSLGFAMFFSQPDDLFPGLDREGLIRPPSLLPPSVPNKNADIFTELLRMLQGYPVHVRDEIHRQELLRDARYFRFKGLEQRLIPHSITYNPIRRRSEIVLRLENVQKSGISVPLGAGDGDGGGGGGGDDILTADVSFERSRYVRYARPLVDDQPADMILEIGESSTKIHFTAQGPRAEFFLDTKTRMAKLLEIIATKLDLPPSAYPYPLPSGAAAAAGAGGHIARPPGENFVQIVFEDEASIVLDGEDYQGPLPLASTTADLGSGVQRKKRRIDDVAGEENAVNVNGSGGLEWVVRTGQWRLRIQGSEMGGRECVLVAVKLDAVSCEKTRNAARGFLLS